MPPLDPVESDPAIPARVDVAIIGGGIVGISTALFLARRGVSVAVLEKGLIAAEQSGRNWGWCRQQNRDLREMPLMQQSMDLWRNLGDELGLDTSYRETGLIYVTRDESELAAWSNWISSTRGMDVGSRVLSAAEARALTPGNSRSDWIGGVHSARDGRAEPAVATSRLATAARQAGATLHQACAVRGLDITGGRVSGVVTEHGRIAASSVLCAGGAWASMLCRRHGIDLPQAGIRSTIFVTEPGPEIAPGGLVTSDVTLSRRMDGGYIVAAKNRGRVDLTPQGLRYARAFLPTFRSRRKSLTVGVGPSFFKGPEAWHGRWSLDRATPFEAMRVLAPEPDHSIVAPALEVVAQAYPALAHLRPAHVWGGWIDCTPDSIPVFSAVAQLPGFFLGTGLSGHGFGIGPAAGQLLTDLITGGNPSVDPSPFRYSRFTDGSNLATPGMM